MNEAAPQRLGRYRLVEVLGTGAFSAVHRAVDERLDDVVALKVLADNHSLDPPVRERFLTEGRVLRRIDSPHVVAVHDLGESDRGQPFLVLELADRGTLAARVGELRQAGWKPTVDDLLAVLEPLVAALEAVHAADVVHRDLSPNNVLLRSTGASGSAAAGSAVLAPDERLLVADLGLCKDLAVHSGITVAGGTDGFRPPEQRGGPSSITSTADLWSLAALTVWLISGDAPREGEATKRLVEAAGLPAGLAPVLDAGLQVDPARRPAEVGSWWRSVRDTLGPRSQPSPAGAPPPTPQAPRTRRLAGRVALVVAALVVGALVALVGTALLDRPSITAFEDGTVRTERQDGPASVAIVGPSETTVGASVTLAAEIEGVADAVWVDPGGGVHTGPRIEVQPQSAGSAVVRLVGLRPGGESLEVTHRLAVNEP